MDDRYNRCDVCGEDIIEETWSQQERRNVPTGQKEIKTPVTILKISQFGDGVIHESCLPKLIVSEIGAGL